MLFDLQAKKHPEDLLYGKNIYHLHGWDGNFYMESISKQKYIYIYVYIYIHVYMGVSKNSGTPKWMVYNGNPYFFNGWFGGKTPYFRKHPYIPDGSYRDNDLHGKEKVVDRLFGLQNVLALLKVLEKSKKNECYQLVVWWLYIPW